MNETDQKRPYAATSNVLAVIERTRSRNLPETIDDDFMRIAGIGDAVFGRVRQALQFLNLIQGDGAPTMLLQAIARAPEQEYRELLEGAIREAYEDDFAVVDPAQDTQMRIMDAFRKYEPRSQTNRMVMLWLGLCREAGISVLDAPRERKMQTSARSSKPKPSTGKAKDQRGGHHGGGVGGGGNGTPARGTTTPPPGLLFGVTEDDIAALDDADFEDVWGALGKVARARARRSVLKVWRSEAGDIPVKVNGHLGTGPDGREYVSVEGSSTGIPADEVEDAED